MSAQPQSLRDILRAFEATEANILKLERLWEKMQPHIGSGLGFGSNVEYDSSRRSFTDILSHLPAIDGWRLEDTTCSLDEVGQMRFDAAEIGELYAHVAVEDHIEKPGKELAEYRFRFDRQRRLVVRNAVIELITGITEHLSSIPPDSLDTLAPRSQMPENTRAFLQESVEQVDVLLGSSVEKPPRWDDLQRHLAFGMTCDLQDIIRLDWPAVRPAIEAALYGENDPLPVTVADLGSLVIEKSSTPVPTRLNWDKLRPEEFERLIFTLLNGARGYENPEWLMHTNAPDRGRDLSVTRVIADPLTGTRRERVVVQCKHQPKRSIDVREVVTLKEQMQSWGPPRVDTLIIATTGRFSGDAVTRIEAQNHSDHALRIEMWPENHIERLLAERPYLIAEFGLR
jgi:hypothetical protein